MECGIIGLPNVGKSSFFKLLTNNEVLIKNYPFSTIKPNISYIKVYDNRIEKIAKLLNYNKVENNNYIKLIDIAGIIKNSYKGKGLGNIFLSHINNTKILINIIRFFYNKEIININNNIIDPIYEYKIIKNELIMKDIVNIKKKILINDNIKYKNILKKILLLLKKKKKKDIKKFYKIENNNLNKIKNINLLSIKPCYYILNINKYTEREEIKYIKKYFLKKKEKILFLDIKKNINNNNKKNIKKLINKIYYKLNYNIFFTIDEKRKKICSWKIKNNTYAYKASEKIHSTFSKKIIKIKKINYKKFIINFNIKNYKNNFIIKNKFYKIKDGDIIYFILNK
ncbi:MAG: hypothetical protein RDO_0650 [Flavobacteriales endosymbiont of Rhyzopertha dominica]|nr:MAG: DUF933 domain-containing protein [Candidatus Shikimatogenerans bostrichidophilus]